MALSSPVGALIGVCTGFTRRLIPFLNHYEIRRTDDDSARSTARKGQRLNRNDLEME